MNAPWHLLTRGHPLLAWRWLRSDLARWLTGITYHRSGRADRVTSQFWAGWDTGTEGNLTVDLPYLQDGYPGADLVPLPPWESTPQLVTTLNSPGSHALPAPRAGGLNADSGLMPAVTEHIAAALGVPSRTRWLDEAFDRVLLDLHAEMAILDHRYAYRELVAA